MLHLLDGGLATASERDRARDALVAHVRGVVATKGRGDRTLVARAEADVRANPAKCIRFDETGLATVTAARSDWRAGRFTTPSIGELKSVATRARVGAPARVRLVVLDGASPATDIGALQATAPPGSLFQVASQFNCLESPGPYVTDVASYLRDPTQGPRASISALPGLLLRHYAAPGEDGSRFVQTTAGRQLDLLRDVATPGVATVQSGYLRSHDVADAATFARTLKEHVDRVRIGLHDEIDVVLGYDWDGAVVAPRTIAQVFTSTLAAGGYGTLVEADGVDVCRGLLRAAYLGTLLGAAALGKRYAVLTLIGGGVFGNPVPVIWEAIRWALAEVEPHLERDLCVVMNGRNLGESVPAADLAAAAGARGGALVRFAPGGGVEIQA